jgi:PAS domain S-box-containing protein
VRLPPRSTALTMNAPPGELESGPLPVGPAVQAAAVFAAVTGYLIIATALDGVVTVFNAGAERMLGYREMEVVGRMTPVAWLDAPELARYAARLGVAAGFDAFVLSARQGVPETHEWNLKRKDGSRFPALMTITAVTDAHGSVSGYVGMAHDVTDRVRVEVERDRLESERDQFFASISHELRSPLATIVASVGAVLAHEPPDLPFSLHRLLVIIDKAADDMARLVEALLALSSWRAGRIELSREVTDVRQVAVQAADGIEPRALQRRQRLELDLPRAPLRAWVDADRLRRVLLVLLVNATTYGRDEGSIILRLQTTATEALFSVVDDGPGIPDGAHDRIFEPFYRGDTEAVRHIRGSGLGLSVARAMVELHGGRIWAEETPGGGATLQLVLPLQAAGGQERGTNE